MFSSVREHTTHPGVFAVAALTLALGIGGATTMYSTLAGIGIGLAPVADPDATGRVFAVNPSAGLLRGPVSLAEYDAIRTATPAFGGLAAFSSETISVRVGGASSSVEVQRVSDDFFRTLGFSLAAGRGFSSRDAQPSAAPAAIVSERFCRTRWGRPSAALGRRLDISGADAVVVGVLPDRSWFPAKGADIWTPLTASSSGGADQRAVYLVGRLARGASWDQARAQLSAVGRSLSERDPAERAGTTIAVIPLQEDAMKRAGFGLIGLFGPGAVVLLVACGNVAILLLARGTRREREMAVRVALGASRARLVVERMAESAWMAAGAGLIGLGLAWAGTTVVRAWFDRFKPGIAEDVRLRPAALAFAVAVTLLLPLVIGLVPAWLATRRPDLPGLREASRHRQARKGPYGARDLLVVLEMALAVVLVLAAGLLGAFVWEMNHVERHFDSTHVLAVDLDLSRFGARHGGERETAYLDAGVDRLRALPGVTGVAAGETPFPINERPVTAEFDACAASPAPTAITTMVVGAGYLETIRLRPTQGRTLDGRDAAGAPAAAVVSEWLARRCWPGGSAVGQRVRLKGAGPVVVVGVVPDAMTNSALGRILPRPPMYLASSQQHQRTATLVVRVDGDPLALVAAVRGALRQIDPSQPEPDLATLDSLLASRFAEGWMLIGLMDAFGALALALAAVGLFSVTSYSVAERTREFGVRMALGASPSAIARLVLARALTVAGIGAGAAAVLTVAMTRVMWAELVSVGANSPAGFGAIALALSAVTVAACLVPAVRATRVDPIAALRTE